MEKVDKNRNDLTTTVEITLEGLSNIALLSMLGYKEMFGTESDANRKTKFKRYAEAACDLLNFTEQIYDSVDVEELEDYCNLKITCQLSGK